MIRRYCVILSAALLLSGCRAPASMAPKPDFHDIPGYMRALHTSTDPNSKTLLQQIGNGSRDLTNERNTVLKMAATVGLSHPVPPAHRNAATVYAELEKQLDPNTLKLPIYAQSLSADHRYTRQQLAVVRKVLDGHAQAIRRLHMATEMRECAFPGDTLVGRITPFETYASMRNNARIIRTETYLLATDRKFDQAVANQASGFRLADQVGTNRSVISLLVSSAIDTITEAGMRDILTIAGPNEHVDAMVMSSAMNRHRDSSLRDSLVGEALGAMRLYDWGRRHGPFAVGLGPDFRPVAPAADASVDETRFISDLEDAQEAYYLHSLLQLIADADLPAAQRRIAFASAARFDASNPIQNHAAESIPTLSSVGKTYDRPEAQRQVTIASAAVLGTKARTGAFPATLPGSYTDPFSGKPLIYHREGTRGFVVYSVGPDGNFDGIRDKAKPRGDHIFYRYPVQKTPAPLQTR